MIIKEITKLIAGLIFLFLGAYLLFLKIPKSLEEKANSGVSVGQIWMWKKSEKTPFKNEEIIFYKVLDVKDSYVKYMNLSDGYISSSKIGVFKYQSKKIKDGSN